MKILVVHPGSPYSVSDVYDGLCYGLRANGAAVVEARLDGGLAFFADCLDAIEHAHAGAYPLPPWAVDPSALAVSRVINQALVEGVDRAVVVTGLKVHYTLPLTLRAYLRVPTALLCTETPYDPLEREIAPLYDHVFTHERAGLPLFGDHPSVHFLPHAYHPERHTPGPAEAETASDVYFVGAGFDERRALFAPLRAALGARFVCHGVLWDDTPLDRERSVWVSAVANTEAVRWYRSARISLNHHRTTTVHGTGEHIAAAAAQSLGPRAFEIAACASFQLCDDRRADLATLFAGTVPTYRAGDAADLARQARHWLAHDERRARAAAAQHQAVAPHHWGNRARQLLEVIA